MKFKIRFIVFVIIMVYPIFYNSMAAGEDLIPDLKGKWNGTAFLYADQKGFNSVINRSITIDVTKQSGFDFNGEIEIKEKGIIRKTGFSGFIDKKRRYLCLIVQGGDTNMGYLITKSVMKVHFRSIGHPSEITVYRLIKEKRSSSQYENLSNDKSIESVRRTFNGHSIFGWLPEGIY